MRLDVQSVINGIKPRLDFDGDIDLSYETMEDGTHPFPEKVSVRGSVVGMFGAVELRADVTAAFHAQCARCGKPVVLPYEGEISGMLIKDESPAKPAAKGSGRQSAGDGAVSADEVERIVLENDDKLDVDALVHEHLMLNMPMRFLCREDCAGLCQMCGADLNLGGCGCKKETTDPRLAVLKELLDREDK